MTKTNWLFWLLLLPMLALNLLLDLMWANVLLSIVTSATITVLLLATQRFNKWLRFFCISTLIVFYFITLLITLFEVSLFDFTGKGFNNEVFFHFELESARIAFNQYPLVLSGFGVLLILYTWLIHYLLKKSTSSTNHTLALVALLLLFLVSSFNAVGRLSTALYQYLGDSQVKIEKDAIQQFQKLGIINDTNLTNKINLTAHFKDKPKNLILLYLESFNQGLTEQKQFPELTPNLKRLANQYQSLPHLSSAYVTIEGVISSQCGTMLPMTAGNNTFLNSGQLMSNMPCLGDILKTAGYSQYYLGGAAMEFAGKGKFFEEHGYDHIWGSEYWYANGFKSKQGVWGLSDTQLFTNAIETIETAAKNPPYNVTLLTLGTHLPGYVYEGCSPYPNSDEAFISAIHCTDQLVGKFVDELESKGLLDDAVLMIVADHGVFPTAKMKELFGEMIQDRRLVAITNYQTKLKLNKMASYDLAPTLLDMLNIEHNAKFLFGQSLLSKSKEKQKFVTRYLDWQGESMISNNHEACAANQAMQWPLNSCHKEQLLALTSQLLEFYSFHEAAEPLACEINITAYSEKTEKDKIQWSLMLNEQNHFEHFYHEGYLLNSLNISSGSFVFELNDDLAVIKHAFFKNDESSQTQLDDYLKTATNAKIVITLSKPSSENSIADVNIRFIENNMQRWELDSNNLEKTKVNICQ